MLMCCCKINREYYKKNAGFAYSRIVGSLEDFVVGLGCKTTRNILAAKTAVLRQFIINLNIRHFMSFKYFIQLSPSFANF